MLSIIAENNGENINIETLFKSIKVSDTTLFRLFKNHLRQNPKSYMKTVRFRKVLHEVLHHKNSLTRITYSNQYYDQAHFNNEFKKFSDHSPTNLIERVSSQQDDLIWIYNKVDSE